MAITDDQSTMVFYDAAGASELPSGHMKVWTQALNSEKVNAIFDTELPQTAVDKIAKKQLRGYMPPIVALNTVDIIVASIIEYVANENTIMPAAKILYELDCSGREYRKLDGLVRVDEKSQPEHLGSSWAPVTPDSNEDHLLAFVCADNAKKQRR